MNIQNHPVVSREEWLAARKQHLAHEKAFTKERDKLSAERRALPWVKIDKDYHFQGPRRRTETGRPVWRPQSIGHLPLHVRRRMGRRLPRLLVPL